MEPTHSSLPEQIASYARLMFERRLLDTAGGNVSARQGNTLYITPRYSGSQRHWQLQPEDILSGPVSDDTLLQHPSFSREGKAHLAIYRNFPDVTGIIHAHPFHVMPFCAAVRPIPPVLESTQKFGVVECVAAAPAHSAELATYVVEGLRGKEERVRLQAAAVLLPYHGIIVAGKNLLAAVDALERIDWNAWCILAQQLMPD
jgi:L-fuculose-phosphate aldolase